MKSVIFLFLLVASTHIFATTDPLAKQQSEHYFPRVGVAVMVFNKEGKILLGQRKGSHGGGKWQCPGGNLEFGETVEEGARRELAEETGLNIVSYKCGPWMQSIFKNEKKHFIILFILVTEFTGEVQVLEPDKCVCWDWFDTSQLPSPIFDSIPAVLSQIDCEKGLRNGSGLERNE